MSTKSIQKNSEKTVVVGLTGRTDSAVAAFLLKKQGYKVVGVSLLSMDSDHFSGSNDKAGEEISLPRCHISNLDRIIKYCEQINIPFYASDTKAQFETEVIDTIITNKLTAKANTSCFNCTQMRMKILYNKMKYLKADYFATGHYCKVYKNLVSDEYFIHSSKDPLSDQSHLLAGLEKKYMQNLILPLGELSKKEVLKIAENFSLQVEKSNVQTDICFHEQKSYLNFLERSIPPSLIKEGPIINIETEANIGEHQGIISHYITEKEFTVKGSTTLDSNLEIVSYDFSSSTIGVGHSHHLTCKGFQLINLRLNNTLDKTKPIGCYVKFKHNNSLIQTVMYLKNNSSAYLNFKSEVYPLISGDLVAIYDSDGPHAKVIGQGEIGLAGNFCLLDRVSKYKNNDREGKLDDDKENKIEKDSLFRF